MHLHLPDDTDTIILEYSARYKRRNSKWYIRVLLFMWFVVRVTLTVTWLFLYSFATAVITEYRKIREEAKK